MAPPFLLISILFEIIFSSYIFVLFLQKIEFISAELLILYKHSITKCSTQLKPLI
jgi:hypothetical protein